MKCLSLSLKIILLIAFVVFLGSCGDDGDKAAFYGWAVGSNVDGYGTIIHTKNGGITWVRQGSPAMIPDIYIEDVTAVDHKNV